MAGEPIQITLTDEDAIEFVRSKVASGQYASAADVVREGLDALKREVDEQERWEREILAMAHDRVLVDPGSLLSVEEVERSLEAKRRERRAS
jgi:putative addiction module CopG family antidote